MSIIVTAASGRLGSLVVEALLTRGATPSDIIATSRDTAKLAHLSGRGVRASRLDYNDADTIDSVIKAGDTVILISSDAINARLAQHTAVVDAAAAAGAARVIYTSVLRASTTDLILAPDHKATEEHIAASGVPATILRNGWYIENQAALIDVAHESGVITASVGNGRVAGATRQDFAEAAAAVALDESTTGRTYELTGDSSFSWNDLTDALSHIIGQPVKYESITPEEHADRLRSAGLDDGTVSFLIGIDGNIRDGVLSEVTTDLAELIGRPTTPLLDGLKASA
ncbi:NmrA family NAD(P)-binding protein [Arthrobacter sp. TMS1-12-1]